MDLSGCCAASAVREGLTIPFATLAHAVGLRIFEIALTAKCADFANCARGG
jgi:hypothetical protein